LRNGDQGATLSNVTTGVETNAARPDVKQNSTGSATGTRLGALPDLRKAKDACARGGRFYRSKRYAEARDAFREAVEHDVHEPLYYYFLAMTYYQLRQLPEAERALGIATTIERDRPIKNWGPLLSRYQGQPRLWVEHERAAVNRHVSH
jgi:tetratricopeptide (TPR) repeat protein